MNNLNVEEYKYRISQVFLFKTIYINALIIKYLLYSKEMIGEGILSYCLYLRKSRTDKDFETGSIEETLARHEKILLEIAKKRNFSISKIYREVVSGETIVSRPKMKQLLFDVEKGLWDGVLVMEVERLARGDTIDQGIVAKTFKYSYTKIITPSKTYDPNNEFDEEYFEFGLFMSRREYKTINRRIQRGRVVSAKEGKFLGSVPPFGYDKVKIKGDKGYTLEINDNAKIVQLIFNLYVNGKEQENGYVKPYGLSLIAKELDCLEIQPLKSEKWNSSSIKTILTNPVYIGKIRWSWDKEIKVIENGIEKRVRKHNDDCIFVDGLHTAVISEDLFNKAQHKLKSKKIYPIASNKILKNPLAGIVYCGECGSLMTRTIRRSHNKNIKEYSLACPNIYCDNVSSRMDIIEKTVIDSAQNWLNMYQLNWEEKNEVKNNNDILLKEKLMKKILKEISIVDKQISKTYDLLERDIYSIDKFNERNKTLLYKKEKLEKNLSLLEKEIKNNNEKQHMKIEFIPNMKKLIDLYYSLEDIHEKNKLLKKVFEKIEYTKNERAAKNKINEALIYLKIFPKIPK